jgi:tight adherence protein C
MPAVTISAVLMTLSALFFLAAALKDQSQRRELARRMGISHAGRAGGESLKQLGGRTLGQWAWNIDAEVRGLLDRYGWRKPAQRALFFAIQIGLPLVAMALVAVYYSVYDGAGPNGIVLLFAAGIGYLLPKRVLAMAVDARRKRIAVEVPTMIPLLRMFFEVGMTVEQALRVLVTEGTQIVPELAQELKQVLMRVDAGLDLGQELRAMAQVVDVDDLTECVGILEQLLRQGGGALASLKNLKTLLDERRMTALEEAVSKLSAKMSGVMVAFLFPALLIVLAGPGFIAITKALGG